jgi:hypothetical protein
VNPVMPMLDHRILGFNTELFVCRPPREFPWTP